MFIGGNNIVKFQQQLINLHLPFQSHASDLRGDSMGDSIVRSVTFSEFQIIFILRTNRT